MIKIEEMLDILVDFTINELIEKKGKCDNYFEWNFDLRNSNLIPILKIYDNDNLLEFIEATEFSIDLQDILKDVHTLYKWINKKHGLEARNKLSAYLKRRAKECLSCKGREICNLIRFRI